MTRQLPALLVLSWLLPSACARSDGPPASEANPPAAVTVGRVTDADIGEQFESGGVVRARLTATLASRVSGPIETVTVSSGSRVRRGQTLLTLECRELDANVGRARASLASSADTMQAADADVRAADSALTLAKATSDRVRVLYEKRSATAQEWDQAAASLQEAEARTAAARARAAAARSGRDAAEAALHAAETALSYATLAAPFDGVVVERFVDPGTLASPGMPLLVIEDPGELRLHVQVDEFRARSVGVGQTAQVRLQEGGTWMPARIEEIGRVDPSSHSFLVKLQLPTTETRSGLFGRARFTSGARRGLTVPASSLLRRGQLTYVFTVGRDNVARLRPIVVVDADGESVEVLAGLDAGDTVVLAPSPSLADGAVVARQQ